MVIHRIEPDNFDGLVLDRKMRLCLFNQLAAMLIIRGTEKATGRPIRMTVDQKWKGFLNIDSLYYGSRQERRFQLFLAVDGLPNQGSMPTFDNRVNQKVRLVNTIALDDLGWAPDLRDKGHAVENGDFPGTLFQGANSVQIF